MPYKNPEDAKARAKRHYAANRTIYIARSLKNMKLLRAKRQAEGIPEKHAPRTRSDKAQERRLRAFVRKAIVWLKETTPCTDCHRTYIAEVMEFDHVRGIKRFNISSCQGFGPANISAEIAKCDLVCANCHRIRTVYRRKLQSSQTLTHQ